MPDTYSSYQDARVTGTLAATGATAAIRTMYPTPARLVVSGTWTGAWTMQAAPIGGVFADMKDGAGNTLSGTANASVDFPVETGYEYKLNWTRTSGTLAYDLSCAPV